MCSAKVHKLFETKQYSENYEKYGKYGRSCKARMVPITLISSMVPIILIAMINADYYKTCRQKGVISYFWQYFRHIIFDKAARNLRRLLHHLAYICTAKKA